VNGYGGCKHVNHELRRLEYIESRQRDTFQCLNFALSCGIVSIGTEASSEFANPFKGAEEANIDPPIRYTQIETRERENWTPTYYKLRVAPINPLVRVGGDGYGIPHIYCTGRGPSRISQSQIINESTVARAISGMEFLENEHRECITSKKKYLESTGMMPGRDTVPPSRS